MPLRHKPRLDHLSRSYAEHGNERETDKKQNESLFYVFRVSFAPSQGFEYNARCVSLCYDLIKDLFVFLKEAS